MHNHLLGVVASFCLRDGVVNIYYASTISREDTSYNSAFEHQNAREYAFKNIVFLLVYIIVSESCEHKKTRNIILFLISFLNALRSLLSSLCFTYVQFPNISCSIFHSTCNVKQNYVA